MSHQPTGTRADVYEQVTRGIIETVEQGADSWRMPWHVTGESTCSPVNVHSGRPYRGINLVCLWASAARQGFTSGTWATFRQWTEGGARVRRGERGTSIVFWKLFDRAEPADGSAEGEGRKRGGVLARGYAVFNADQVDGDTPPATPKLPDAERIAGAEGFFKPIPASIRHGGDRAYYAPTEDLVVMPRFEDFKRPERYYAVLAHELTHWTGAGHRLDRDLTSRFGSRGYAAEELVAELGAAFLCSGLALPLAPRRDHAPYIAHWLDLLRADRRAVFTAASRAQEAVDYLLTVREAALRDAA